MTVLAEIPERSDTEVMRAVTDVQEILRQRETPEPAALEGALWNDRVGPEQYTGGGEVYRAAILEQYKLYVEMADRISARRALANTFFVTLNTAVLTLIGTLWKGHPAVAAGWLAIPLVIVLRLCLAWFWLVRAYRQLK